MEKYNHLDEMKIADLDERQLEALQSAENQLNDLIGKDQEIYLIAFRRPVNQSE